MVSPHASEDFTWANAAYAMGVNINRAFNEYGWCSRIRGIESGGSVEELPAYAFPSDEGGYELTCPTELAISDRRENELSNAGFLPLVYRKNSDFAAFIGSCTLHAPANYDDPDATANARLSARLPYILPPVVSPITSNVLCATKLVRSARGMTCNFGLTTG